MDPPPTDRGPSAGQVIRDRSVAVYLVAVVGRILTPWTRSESLKKISRTVR